MYAIKFLPNATGKPVGKLADVELHFMEEPLSGLKLIGFSIWERRMGGRIVIFPSRQYSVNGERRSYVLLRPIINVDATNNLRATILGAYRAYLDEPEDPNLALPLDRTTILEFL